MSILKSDSRPYLGGMALLLVACILPFCDSLWEPSQVPVKAEQAPEQSVEAEISALSVLSHQDANLPWLVGRWQSECNWRHYGRPVLTSVEVRYYTIIWVNHYYTDRSCISVDESERFKYRYQLIEMVRIVGEQQAALVQLTQLPMGDVEELDLEPPRLELFAQDDNWLYIADPKSGPEHGQPWDLDANFGLQRLR